MTEKRFTTVYDEQSKMMQYVDTQKEEPNWWAIWNANKTSQIMNELADENKQLKKHIKNLEKECVLLHMSSMFSTVKSFNGDVSKRYKYSEKTDTIYDTANNYGQYDKILDKKEITMLLNEYETILKELKE